MLIRIDLVDLFLEYTEARSTTPLGEKAAFKASTFKMAVSVKRVRVDDLLFKRDNHMAPGKRNTLRNSDIDLSARQSLTFGQKQSENLPHSYSKRSPSDTGKERSEVFKKEIFKENTEDDQVQTPDKESIKEDQ